jgi:hypothetical protein
MRRAFLLAYTQLPTGPVENPARSAPPASQPMALLSPWPALLH